MVNIAKIMKRVKKTKLHVPKPGHSLQTTTSKGSPVSLSSETESSDDDSDSSYDSDSSPPPEKSPLPATRPQKAVEAVRYDTIKAVWLPRNKFAENNKILKGLADLWEVVRTIRDRWKTDRDAVKKALESKQDNELPLLRERVDKQLELMEAVLTAAIEFGHPDLLSAYVFPSAPYLLHRAFASSHIRDVQTACIYMRSATTNHVTYITPHSDNITLSCENNPIREHDLISNETNPQRNYVKRVPCTNSHDSDSRSQFHVHHSPILLVQGM